MRPPLLEQIQAFYVHLSQFFLLSIHPTQVSAISIYFYFFLVVFGALFVVFLAIFVRKVMWIHGLNALVKGCNGWL